jgi:hypothetical protein
VNTCFGLSAQQTLLLVGGARTKGAGIDRQNGYRLANKVTYLCGAAHFNQSASTPKSRDTGMTLKFWQCVIKKYKKTTKMYIKAIENLDFITIRTNE